MNPMSEWTRALVPPMRAWSTTATGSWPYLQMTCHTRCEFAFNSAKFTFDHLTASCAQVRVGHDAGVQTLERVKLPGLASVGTRPVIDPVTGSPRLSTPKIVHI